MIGKTLALTALLALAPLAASAAEPVPWAAAASADPIQEEKSFRSGEAELSGTLHLPRDGKALAAIVVAHGASSPLRTSPLYRHLVEMLPARGWRCSSTTGAAAASRAAT